MRRRRRRWGVEPASCKRKRAQQPTGTQSSGRLDHAAEHFDDAAHRIDGDDPARDVDHAAEQIDDAAGNADPDADRLGANDLDRLRGDERRSKTATRLQRSEHAGLPRKRQPQGWRSGIDLNRRRSGANG